MFRNPHEGMSKFLSSIGDMRRTWEQEERVRQNDERLAQQHKQQMEEAAQRMALAKSGDERANLAANAQRLLDPLQREDYTTQIEGNRVGTAGKRVANLKTQAEYEQYLKDIGPGGWQGQLRDLERRKTLADIGQSNAAAGASAAATRERQAAIDAAERTRKLMEGWGQQPYGSGELTYEQAMALGMKGTPGKLNAAELRFITTMAAEGVEPEKIAAYLQNADIRKNLGLGSGVPVQGTPPMASHTSPNAAPVTTMQGKMGRAGKKD